MVAWLAGAFGVLAIVLVAVGLYGIIAYLAVSRRNEIGIRLALGSTRAQIVMLVLRDNMWLMVTGLAIGLPLAAAAMRGARALLFGLSPTDGASGRAPRAFSRARPRSPAVFPRGARQGSDPTAALRF